MHSQIRVRTHSISTVFVVLQRLYGIGARANLNCFVQRQKDTINTPVDADTDARSHTRTPNQKEKLNGGKIRIDVKQRLYVRELPSKTNSSVAKRTRRPKKSCDIPYGTTGMIMYGAVPVRNKIDAGPW